MTLMDSQRGSGTESALRGSDETSGADVGDVVSSAGARLTARTRTRVMWREHLDRDLAHAFDMARAVGYEPGSPELQDLAAAEARYTACLRAADPLRGR